MEIPIICPSHKRAGRVITHKSVADVKLCIPEVQWSDYREHHSASVLIVHPDAISGISTKRQWIVQQFPSVFMLDDDVLQMTRIWRPAGDKTTKVTLRPEEARDLIFSTAETCRELGAFLFGFNSHCAPMTYNGFKPFRFGGYTPGGAFGLLAGHGLHFPSTNLPCEDWWICLLNAFVNRYSWFDCRFAFGFKDTYTGIGGCAEIRSGDGEKLAYDYLKRHFGKAVQPKTANTSKNRQTTKRELNPAARSMHIPWKH